MKEAKVFPVSSGGRLEVRKTLLETLYVDSRLLAQSTSQTDRKALVVFVEGAEGAWANAKTGVLQHETNFILWLRGLLVEARQNKVWIPRIFIKRLRELERGDLALYVHDVPVSIELHEGLPAGFRECCRLFGWSWPIVPNTAEGSFLNLSDHSGSSQDKWTKLVNDVV